jgi:hypothetical protein
LLHTLAFDANVNVVPALIVPVAGAAGVGVAAGGDAVGGADVGGFAAGFGAGDLAGAFVTGAETSGGAATSSNFGTAAESVAANAKSRPNAESLVSAVSELLPPQAARTAMAKAVIIVCWYRIAVSPLL